MDFLKNPRIREGAAVFAAILGFSWSQFSTVGEPFSVSRPPSSSSEGLGPNHQNIPARLWQDPFEAIGRWNQPAEKDQPASEAAADPTSFRNLDIRTTQQCLKEFLQNPLRKICEWIRTAEKITKPLQHSTELAALKNDVAKVKGQLTVLPVMVSTEKYIDSYERRMRLRYAVSSALAVRHYVPSDSQHIGFVTLPIVAEQGQAANAKSTNIPYEWFAPNALDYHLNDFPKEDERVLVLWIPEEDISGRPLTNLFNFISDLAIRPYDILKTPAKVRIIGPTDSTTVRRMLDENRFSIQIAKWSAGYPDLIPMYSCKATAAEVLLTTDVHSRNDAASAKAQSTLIKGMERNGIEYKSTICSDDILMEMIVAELNMRRINLGEIAREKTGADAVKSPKEEILLISEYDKFYGRAAPLTFIAKAMSNYCGKDEFPTTAIDLVSGVRHPPEAIRRYSYLRGLDGIIPGDTSELQQLKKGGDNRAELGDLEKPDGRSQFDYVRRFVASLTEDQDQSKVVAIGIMGSDVYDKLLMLQALKPRFPNAIFFSTDLDAHMFQPEALAYTRNLIVASAFGLALDKEHQQYIPPFRDSYQTSTFWACQQAILDESHGAHLIPTPGIFEIGLHGPVALSCSRYQEAFSWEWFAVSAIATMVIILFLRDRGLRRRSWRYLIYAIAVLIIAIFFRIKFIQWWYVGIFQTPIAGWLIFLLVFIFSTTICITLVKAWPEARIRGALIAASVFTISVFMTILHGIGKGVEPLEWWSGVSIWPTEFIRLFAFALAMLFLALIGKWHAESKTTIMGYIGTSEPSAASSGQESGYWKKFILWYQGVKFSSNIALPFREWAAEGGEDDLWPKWRQHSFSHGVVISVVMAVAWLGFGFIVMSIFGFPRFPGRDAYFLDRICLYSSLFPMLFMICFSYYGVKLCRRFIHERLLKESTPWPEAGKTLAESEGVPDLLAGHWLNVMSVARLTEPSSKLIIFPFVLLVILMLSRSRHFDDWTWPPSLIILFVTSLLSALVSALWLRWAADGLRKHSLAKMRDALNEKWMYSGQRNIDASHRAIAQVEALDTGAFVPLYRHPVFAAILLPFGGLGIEQVMSFFATLHLQ